MSAPTIKEWIENENLSVGTCLGEQDNWRSGNLLFVREITEQYVSLENWQKEITLVSLDDKRNWVKISNRAA